MAGRRLVGSNADSSWIAIGGGGESGLGGVLLLAVIHGREMRWGLTRDDSDLLSVSCSSRQAADVDLPVL